MPSAQEPLKDYLLCLGRLQRMQGRELELVLQAWREGEPQARRRLHEDYLPEVLRWVLPYRSRSNRFQGLIEAGNRSLGRALQDPRAMQAAALGPWLQAQVTRELEAYLAAQARR